MNIPKLRANASVADKPGRSGKEWTDEEVDELLRLMNTHQPIGEIALALDRSEAAVRGKVFDEAFGRKGRRPPAPTKRKKKPA